MPHFCHRCHSQDYDRAFQINPSSAASFLGKVKVQVALKQMNASVRA
jgi:hypothetical protein